MRLWRVLRVTVLLGIFASLFLENSISTASLAKTNFHQNHTLIKSHSIFGKDYFCSVRRWRPPDWLTLYPWRRLSAVFRGFLINLCLTPLVAQSRAESGRVTAFSALLQRKTISLTPHWTRAKTAQDKNLINQWYQYDFPVFKFSIIGGLYRKFLILPFTRKATREMRGERRQGRTKRRNVRYVVIKKPFIKTFAAVLLTSLVPDSHTRINFAFRRKAGRDILSSQRTYRRYIVCYNDNQHLHVFFDHWTIYLRLGIFATGLFSSWWIGIANYTTTLVLLRL